MDTEDVFEEWVKTHMWSVHIVRQKTEMSLGLGLRLFSEICSVDENQIN